MRGALRRAWAIVRKDLRTELRTRHAVNTMVFFAVSILLILGFAMGPDAQRIEQSGPGLIWVSLLFTAVLGLGRVFDAERGNRGMEGLLNYPGDRRAVFLGKFMALALLLTAVQAVLLVFASLMYNLDVWSVLPQLLGVLALGTVGVAGIGTLYGALTLNLRASEVLLPLLMLPLIVPPVVASISATELLIAGDPFGRLGGWIRLLAVFGLVFTLVPLMTFERALAD